MGKTYFLDLQTLLTYLRNQACLLTTQLSLAGKAFIGEVTVKDGVITHCLIHSQDGTRIVGDQAYQQLQTCTQWQVHLERQAETGGRITAPLSPSPESLPPSSPALRPESVPRSTTLPLKQKRMLDLSVSQTLSIKQRLNVQMVLTMINGRRSAEEIKALLHLPPDLVDEILERLRRLDIIE